MIRDLEGRAARASASTSAVSGNEYRHVHEVEIEHVERLQVALELGAGRLVEPMRQGRRAGAIGASACPMATPPVAQTPARLRTRGVGGGTPRHESQLAAGEVRSEASVYPHAQAEVAALAVLEIDDLGVGVTGGISIRGGDIEHHDRPPRGS